MLTFFYDDGTGLLRVLVVGVLAYVAVVMMLRISGNRTLSKMNAFDFIVTIALGSTLSSIIISQDVALAEGVLALALLIGLQYIVTWLSVRSSQIHRLVKSEPVLVLHRGDMLPDAMRRARHQGGGPGRDSRERQCLPGADRGGGPGDRRDVQRRVAIVQPTYGAHDGSGSRTRCRRGPVQRPSII